MIHAINVPHDIGVSVDRDDLSLESLPPIELVDHPGIGIRPVRRGRNHARNNLVPGCQIAIQLGGAIDVQANIPARKVADHIVVAVDPQYFTLNCLWARKGGGRHSYIRPAPNNAGGIRSRRPIEPDDHMISDCNVIAHCARFEIHPHVTAREIPYHIGIGINSSHITLYNLPACRHIHIAVPQLVLIVIGIGVDRIALPAEADDGGKCH